MHFTDYCVRLSAYAVVLDAEDRILLSWFNGDDPGWTLPGGGVEFDESVERAVVREVCEETGYDVALDRVLLVDTHTAPVTFADPLCPPRPYKAVRVVYCAHVNGGNLGTVEVRGTTDRAAWLSRQDALSGVGRTDLIQIALEATNYQ